MAAALPFVAGGLQLFSAMQQGDAAEAAAEGRARADDYNRKVAEQNASTVAAQTEASLERQDRERRIRLGQARANIGASGVSGGSFFDILQSNAAQEELDLLTIESEGLLRQNEFRSQANLLGASAYNTRQQGSASKAASIMGGVSKGFGALDSAGVFN